MCNLECLTITHDNSRTYNIYYTFGVSRKWNGTYGEFYTQIVDIRSLPRSPLKSAQLLQPLKTVPTSPATARMETRPSKTSLLNCFLFPFMDQSPFKLI